MNEIDRLVDLIARADRRGATDLMRDWAAEHGYERLAEEILLPTLEKFDEISSDARQSPLARGYVAAKVAEDAMAMIADATHSGIAATPTKGRVVIGNIEDDFHALGRRIVGTFLRADGWDVCDLGNDVPPEEFVDKAVEIGAKIIGASAMMYTTAKGIRRLRDEIDRRGLSGRIQLAVGGAVFVLRPELVEEMGGDGSARTALAAPALFDELWVKANREAAAE